jgi:hypothetical protein
MKTIPYLLLLGLLAGCSTSNDPSPSQSTNVYVAGYTFNANRNTIAEYWKNGTAVTLTKGTSNAGTTGIDVSGTNVYACGWDQAVTSGTYGGKYWKNGTELSVSNTCLGMVDVKSIGADLFVLGVDASGWNYWKNNTAVALVDTTAVHPTELAIEGNDVYVSGYTEPLYWPNVRQASCWKNGTLIFRAPSPSFAKGIATAGNDVFLVGYIPGSDTQHNTALYWKNGVASILTDGTTNAFAYAILVSGTDVYVAGSENQIAKYWKNGVAVSVTDGTHPAEGLSIAVNGSDVYVAGYEGTHARLWKNGVVQNLSDASADGAAVEVVVK